MERTAASPSTSSDNWRAQRQRVRRGPDASAAGARLRPSSSLGQVINVTRPLAFLIAVDAIGSSRRRTAPARTVPPRIRPAPAPARRRQMKARSAGGRCACGPSRRRCGINAVACLAVQLTAGTLAVATLDAWRRCLASVPTACRARSGATYQSHSDLTVISVAVYRRLGCALGLAGAFSRHSDHRPAGLLSEPDAPPPCAWSAVIWPLRPEGHAG